MLFSDGLKAKIFETAISHEWKINTGELYSAILTQMEVGKSTLIKAAKEISNNPHPGDMFREKYDTYGHGTLHQIP